MKPGKADRVRTHLFFLAVSLLLLSLAAVPAYCQRGTFDVNAGGTYDQFGTLPHVTGAVLDLTGEFIIKKPNPKKGGPAILAGGEVRVPSNAGDHSKEYAVYGGLAFTARSFTFGVDAEVRKILIPSATIENQIVNRYDMELVELPAYVRYRFGPAKRAFVQIQGQPEFSPHYKSPKGAAVATPHPEFDYGYTVRASVGYDFGKWYYAKATAETRYFKFASGLGNPSSLYNWKSNMVTGGVGVRF
jgi:hypothetical protein